MHVNLRRVCSDKNDDQEQERIEQLAKFQQTALLHALSCQYKSSFIDFLSIYSGFPCQFVLLSMRVERWKLMRSVCCYAKTVPLLEKVVYSTCSIHQRENEDVVMAVLPHAKEKGFELACPYPSWPHRGLPVFEGGKHFTVSS